MDDCWIFSNLPQNHSQICKIMLLLPQSYTALQYIITFLGISMGFWSNIRGYTEICVFFIWNGELFGGFQWKR